MCKIKSANTYVCGALETWNRRKVGQGEYD